MVPRRPGSPTGLRCAPRTRGYGPSCAPNPTCSLTCSPHARGWPPVHGRLRPGRSLLPARAGMVPPRRRSTGSCGAAPRTRGDGPPPAAARAWPRSCSPHARGWSRWDRHRCQGADLLPARAGMVPTTSTCPCSAGPAPRTRGDGPLCLTVVKPLPDCSPHARGWSQRGDGGCQEDPLLPARAGMVPTPAAETSTSSTAPRTRGNGPQLEAQLDTAGICSPHARGWSPDRRAPGYTAPRTRGDGPTTEGCHCCSVSCSPHARGWSRVGVDAGGFGDLLPARAGMVPSLPGSSPRSPTAPRTRGDGPYVRELVDAGHFCSPHARVWPHRSGVGRLLPDLLPARGDGPDRQLVARRRRLCSPPARGWSRAADPEVAARCLLPARVRGWSRVRRHPVRRTHLLPARAGMVPTTRRCSPRNVSAPHARDGPHAGGGDPRVSPVPCTRGDGPARSRSWGGQVAAPCSRGDGPIASFQPVIGPSCSSHTRGWFPEPRRGAATARLLLVRAGVGWFCGRGVPIGAPAVLLLAWGTTWL